MCKEHYPISKRKCPHEKVPQRECNKSDNGHEYLNGLCFYCGKHEPYDSYTPQEQPKEICGVYINETYDCAFSKPCPKHSPSQPNEQWEKEFDDKWEYGLFKRSESPYWDYAFAHEDIKSFISQLLVSARSQERERVVKIVRDTTPEHINRL